MAVGNFSEVNLEGRNKGEERKLISLDIDKDAGVLNIANQLFPKADQLKKAIKRTDLLLKFENILSEMISIFYWNSLIEI